MIRIPVSSTAVQALNTVVCWLWHIIGLPSAAHLLVALAFDVYATICEQLVEFLKSLIRTILPDFANKGMRNGGVMIEE